MAVEAKVCGLTRAADAALAVRLGASWLGAVFAEGSPRRVGLPVARELVAASDGVPVMGVFVTESPDEILRLRDRAGLAGAQLHGEYPFALRERLRREELRVWSVVKVESERDLERLDEAAGAADAVLIEPRVAGADGGTGTALPLELAALARARLGSSRMVLAGGLRPDTVERAIALVRPDVVDVSSGIESAPGVKDADLLARFLEVARDAHARP
ncbi:MAG TPA: phosphoribosylanthranilate isomerase [Gemmatimonadales bacterium]|nr:phosphoribosylanthranilate isomerase [Gemmatimonadales bacterium]